MLTLGALLLAALSGRCAETVVWSENFDDATANNRWASDNGVWEIGVPTYGPPAGVNGIRAHSGPNCAATSLTADYSFNTNSRLFRISSFTVPASTSSPRLRFWHWFSTYDSGDKGYVEAKEVGTTVWVKVSPDYVNTSGPWTYASVDLSAYGGKTVQIAFHFVDNGQNATFGGFSPGVSPGWYVDDLALVSGVPAFTMPESFENGWGDWSAENGVWEIGKPTSGPNVAKSGLNCLATVLGGSYPFRTDSRAVSPSFVVPAASTNPRLRFWHWLSTYDNGDKGSIDVKEAGSTAWVKVSSDYFGSSGTWTYAFVDLTAYAGKTVQVAFHFVDNGQNATFGGFNPGVSSGWYVDDVLVESDTTSIGALAITSLLQSQTVNVGASVGFSVTAAGNAPFAYQWQKDGTNIAGATNATLALNNLQASDAGSYYVSVISGSRTVYSNAATVGVRPTNDNFSNAQVLSGTSGSVTGTNASAATEAGEPDSPATSVWFSWIAPSTGRWQFNTIGSAFDTVLRVYMGTALGALTLIAADDNSGGSSTSLLNFSATANSVYRIRIDGGGGASGDYKLNWLQQPGILTQPTNVTFVVGESATLTVVANGGDPTLMYQWRKDAVNITGATGPSLTVNNVQTGSVGNYSVVVSNSTGTVTSDNARLDVVASAVRPAITTQPRTQIVTAGSDVTFSVAVSGTSPFNYAWFNNGVVIGGATSPTLTLRSVQAGDSSGYSVVVTNAAGTVTSNVASLTVVAPPGVFNITSQPLSQIIPVGSAATFSVAADGAGPLTYQWQKDNAAIAGATSGTLTLANVPASAAGRYSVAVTNSAGTVNSNAATLTVVVRPANDNFANAQTVSGTSGTVTGTNANATTESGEPDSPTTSVWFSWTAPSVGRWQFNTIGSGFDTLLRIYTGTALNSLVVVGADDNSGGSLTSSLNFNASGSTTYRIRIDGSGGASGNYILNWSQQPAFTTQPVSLAVVVGQSATFNVVANGDPAPTYQWMQDGRPITGAIGSTLALQNVQTGSTGNYTVVASNSAGGTTSSTARLDVLASATRPTIATQPQAQSVTAGNDVTFTVGVSGTSPFTYVWLRNGSVISGATAASLTLRSVQATDSGGYTVVVTNAGGTATSNAAPLTVATATAPLVITAQPQDEKITAGSTATFAVGATGVSTLSYQWRKDGNPIAGETRATLTLNSVQANNAGLYSVVVTSAAGSIASSAATLTVNAVAEAPRINAQLRDQIVGVGAAVAFDVSVSGTAPFAYQWRLNGAAIPNATQDTLILPNVSAANAGSYTVLVTNSAGSATSSAATLTVNQTPTITTQPADQSVALGSNVTIAVTASGSGPLTYQWSKDGRPIAGANYFILALSNVTNNDAGSYSVAITNGVGNTTSRAATLVVSAAVSKIVNVSVRTAAGTASETLIVGFVVAGSGGTKPVLVRGIGPALTAFGVAGALSDPQLELYNGTIQIAVNDNWGSSTLVGQIGEAARASGAFPLVESSKDAALYSLLQPGGYSAWVTGRDGTGIALMELYDTNPTLPTRLTNVSARSAVGRGDSVLIAGFVVSGNTPKNVLVRAIGPSLGTFGVTGTLSDPQLVLYRGSNEVIATNDDWWRNGGAQTLAPVFTSVGAFVLVSGTKDAALVATLPPGAYSATVSGVDGGTGVALVEVYEVP